MVITAAKKRDAANQALKAWHNQALKYPQNYSLSFSQLLTFVDKGSSGTWRENFGGAVIAAEEYLGYNAVENAMRELADNSSGRVTTYFDGTIKGTEFFDALSGKFSLFSWDRIKADVTAVGEKSISQAVDASKIFLGGSLVYVAVLGLVFVVLAARSK